MEPWYNSYAPSNEHDACHTCGAHQRPRGANGMTDVAQRLERLEAMTRDVLSLPLASPHPIPARDQRDHAVSSAEHTIWSGRPAFFSYAPGVLAAAGWAAVWGYVALQSQEMAWYGTQLLLALEEWLTSLGVPVEQLLGSDGRAWLATGGLTPTVVQTVGGLLALGGVWGLLRRLRHAVGTSYQLTTRHLTVQTGLFAAQSTQLALQHIAHVRLRQSFRGRLWGYAQCRFEPSQSGARSMVWRGVPIRQLTTALLQDAVYAAQDAATARR